jgi:4-amino-4-deoxy-L-arabinose transferase-like glycosyltransferase
MIVPPSSYLLALAVAGWQYLQRRARQEDRRLLALLAVGVGLLASNYYSPDLVHLTIAAPPVFAVIAALAARCRAIQGGRHLTRAIAAALLVVVVIAGRARSGGSGFYAMSRSRPRG